MNKDNFEDNFERIPIPNLDKALRLYYPGDGSKNSQLIEIKSKQDARENGECECQITEGTVYQYYFESEAYHFHDHELITTNKRYKCSGYIDTKLYVGTIELEVVDKNENIVSKLQFEVRSKKMGYRNDYHQMLEDITKNYVELVMRQGAPVTQKMEIDTKTDAKTLYQRFVFMRSIVESEAFNDAIYRIISSPVRKWQETYVEKRICNVRRIGRKEVRQMFASNDRVHCCMSLPTALKDALPRHINVADKCDTVDNPENQFVKYVLHFFNTFCEDLRSNKKATERLKREIESALIRIDGYLNTNFFKEVHLPNHLNLNSPVLQRKEGYREVLQAWIFFDLASKLSWKGGDNIYDAGKRNIAALYEYWCFFKLLEVVEDVFGGNCDPSELVKISDDGINLKLKQGHVTMLKGEFEFPMDLTGPTFVFRKLHYALYYNRIFKGKTDYKRAGSWSVEMRPDYTLSIWPGECKEDEAEHNDLIVHIHFDAKYRVDNLNSEEDRFSRDDELDENCSKDNNIEDECKSTYMEQRNFDKSDAKEDDLLKMHAYRDAIRRTAGAYILYPGTKTQKLREFHELLPGLGAFCLCPTVTSNAAKQSDDDGSSEIEKFIRDVVEHFLKNLPSQRDKMAYYAYDVYSNSDLDTETYISTLQSDNANRIWKMPFVLDKFLFGYCWGDEHLKWISNSHKYNFRAGNRRGALTMNADVLKAEYLVIYFNDETFKIFKLKKPIRPLICTRLELTTLMNYHDQTKDSEYIYYLFELDCEYIPDETYSDVIRRKISELKHS